MNVIRDLQKQYGSTVRVTIPIPTISPPPPLPIPEVHQTWSMMDYEIRVGNPPDWKELHEDTEVLELIEKCRALLQRVGGVGKGKAKGKHDH